MLSRERKGGYTEPEVAQLVSDADLPDGVKALAEWYNGYHFADHVLQDVVLATLSSRDLAKGPAASPERVFQAFILGMLVSMQEQYDVRSEEEAGYGRCDVLVRPKSPGKPGAVLEMKRPKVATEQAVEKALTDALAQIDEKRYVQRLEQAGAAPIVRWGVVFDGKRVWVRAGR